MLELLVALVQEPASVAAAVPVRATETRGEITVTDAGLLRWRTENSVAELNFTVINAGSQSDRILAVTTPAGEIAGTMVRSPTHRGEWTPEPQLVPPGRAIVFNRMTHLEALPESSGPSGFRFGEPPPPRPSLTSVTITFERAGEITVAVEPASPPPPPPRREN